MKIEMEENDINYIERVNTDLANGESIPLFINKKDGEYYIKFVCDDVAKANNFVMDLIMKCDNKENEDKFGVHFLSLNYCHGDDKIASLKSRLQSFINELDNM
jgi:hypothetical protein